MNRSSALSAAALIALAAVTASAQTQPNAPIGSIVRFNLDSGELLNPTDKPEIVAAFPVTMAGSSFMRLYFSQADLAPGTRVRVTSMLDGDVQELDSESMLMWNNSTAYFNGDTVLVEVIAGPHTAGNRLAIKDLGIDMGIRPAGANGQCGIIGGTDTRALSTETWSARIMPVGCTGTIYCNTGGGMVTAGHCVDGQSNLVLHFNVPASTSGCGTVAPPVADQFPVTNWLFENASPSSVGADWAVLSIGANNLGQRPFTRYGTFRALATAPAANGAAANIWGYGVDTTCTRSQVQQYSAGNITSVLSNYYQFNNDIRGGNSGSGFLNASNQVVGIVSHCAGSSYNIATRIDKPNFVSARASLNPCGGSSPPPPPAPANNACASPAALSGSAAGTTVNATNDGTAACGSSNTSPDVWYTFTATCTGSHRFATCTASFDSVLSVHAACGGASIACNDDHASGGAGGCATSTASALDVSLTAGTTYRIRVAGYNGATGTFTLTVTPPSCSTNGSNACAAAPFIGNGSFPFTTVGATTDGPVACGGAGNDIWYRYTASCTGTVTVTTCAAASYDSVLAVYGSACPGTGAAAIACNDDACSGTRSSLTFSSVSGAQYLVRVAGYNGATGTGTLTVSCGGPTDAVCNWVGVGCIADFDADGDTDSDDTSMFLTAWEDGQACADADGDDDTDSDDVITFFGAWEAGC